MRRAEPPRTTMGGVVFCPARGAGGVLSSQFPVLSCGGGGFAFADLAEAFGEGGDDGGERSGRG